MKINKLQTAINIAENYEDNGGASNELSWLLLEGHKGFKHMTTEEIEIYTEEDCGLPPEDYPKIIVYTKESQ